MKRGLLIAPILIALAFLVAGTLNPPPNFARTEPTGTALTGQETAAEILGRGLQFLKTAKSTSYQADYIIEASQGGVTVPLFPAEFRLKYSATLDKYFYEVTAPSIAVGSAMLINRQPGLIAKNLARRNAIQNVSFVEQVAAVEVADGCSGAVCSVDGSTCGECSGGQVAEKTTFETLIDTRAFDLPYLSDFSSSNAELVKTLAYKGETSSVVRFDPALAMALGFSDVLVTVRHRDGAPVAFDFLGKSGETLKHMDASYVGSDLTALTAIDNAQKLELHITLKSTESIKRNVQFNDSIFTRENLKRVLDKKAQLVAE